MSKSQKMSKKAKIENRRVQVSRLVLAGYAYRQVAEELNCSLGTVASDMKVIMARWKEEQVQSHDDFRELELKRLDRAMRALMPAVDAGDDKAINTLIRLSKRRSELKGLDAPIKTETDLRADFKLDEVMKKALERAYGD